MSLKPLICALAGCVFAGGYGQTYVGAEGALKAIRSPAPPAPIKPDPTAALRRSIAAYKRTARKLSPMQSALRWLALVDRCKPNEVFWAPQENDSGDSVFSAAVSASPGPSVWPELETLLRKRLSKNSSAKEVALLALVETLRGRRDEAWTHISQIKELPAERQRLIAAVLVDLGLISERKEWIEDAYRRQAKALSLRIQGDGASKPMELPDLSVLLGRDRARALLVDIFRTFDGEVAVHGSDSFKKMARETALAEVVELKHPQWTLAIDVDGGPLFAALVKRFPDSESGTQENPDWAPDSYSAAATRYIEYLIAGGRIADAEAFAKSQDSPYWVSRRVIDDEVDLLRKRGKLEDYIRFLEARIPGDQDGFLIDAYVDFCDGVGQSARADATLERLPASQKSKVRISADRTVRALLAKRKIAEAAECLHNILQHWAESRSKGEYESYPASELADIGRYLHREDYVELGISAAEREFRSGDDPYVDDWVFRALIDKGRGPEAERLLADALQRRAHDPGWGTPPLGERELECLVRLYAKEGRHEDVLELLEKAPNWGVGDVALQQEERERQDSLPFLAAQALAAVGRKAEAMRVLRFVMQTQRDLDQAYDLLLKLDPKGAGPLLVAMHRSSPLATRPLMWKAEWLRRQGRLAEAEKTVRQAIALDPQDTQVWRSGTRFQAWAILAAVEASRGRAAEARVHRRKVESYRAYFAGRGWMEYGPLIRGPEAGLKALADDPDDFQLRFDVAHELKAAGKTDVAKAQVLEGCRRMSSGLGPASEINLPDEDPEFAALCEGVFREETRKNPKRAAPYAALGDLYQATHRTEKAEASYLKAVDLDQNCFAAWQGLHGLLGETALHQATQDRIALNLVRLAPPATFWPEEGVRDFEKLWSVADAGLRDVPPFERPVFRLPVAEAAMTDQDRLNAGYSRGWKWPSSAGAILVRDRTISHFIELIGTLGPGPSRSGVKL